MWVMEGTDGKRSKGRLTDQGLLPNAVSAVPLNQAWTAAASTGTIDEDSLAIAEVKNFTVSLKPMTTGTVFQITFTGLRSGSFAATRGSLPTTARSRFGRRLVLLVHKRRKE